MKSFLPSYIRPVHFRVVKNYFALPLTKSLFICVFALQIGKMGRYDSDIDKGLRKYAHKDLTKKDINYLMTMYKDLIPGVDSFVFNNGISQPLLSLTGTIPVSYKGSTYNIPVALWLQDSHPFNPPMVFVKPTTTMKIKEGPHVDAAGRVFLPYLTEWKHPSSDLLGLVQILGIIFGENCPVFSVAASSQAARPPAANMQYPGARSPYPQAGYGMPTPGMPATGYPPTATTGYASNAYPQQPTYPNQRPGYNNNPYNPQQQQQQQYPGYNYRQQYPMQAQAGTQQNHAPLTSQQSLTEDQIKASLLSAVREKMTRKLEDVYGQAQAEVQSLQKTQDDLNKGKVQLEDLLNKLDNEQREVDRNIEVLRQKDIDLSEVIQKMEDQTSVSFDVDTAISPTAPLYKQILNSFAEEQALEDTMYYLGDALRRELIDSDVFLKHIRELSRRQFILRALITKCRQKAGLPELT